MDLSKDVVNVDTPHDHDAGSGVPASAACDDQSSCDDVISRDDAIACGDVVGDTKEVEVGQRDYHGEGTLCQYAEKGGLTLKGQINMGGRMEITHNNMQDNRTINKHVLHHQGDLHQHTHHQHVMEGDVIHHHGEVHHSHHVHYSDNEAGYAQIKDQSELAMLSDQTVFVETWAFRGALRQLSDTGLLLLKGPSGSGKTCTAHALLRHYQALGYTPLVLHRFEEWRAHVGGDRQQVIHLEDIFGKDQFQSASLSDWVHAFPTIQQLVTSGKCIVIITVNDVVLDSIHEEHGSSSLLSHTLNLASSDASLSEGEKKRILETHLKQAGKSVSDELFEEVIQSVNNPVLFPAQCKLFAESSLDEREALKMFTAGAEDAFGPCGTGPKVFFSISPDIIKNSLIKPTPKIGRWGCMFMNKKKDVVKIFRDDNWTTEDIQHVIHSAGRDAISDSSSELRKPATSISEEVLTASTHASEAFSRFQAACMKGDNEMMLEMIESDVDVVFSNRNGFTALHVAILTGQANTVQMLLDRKCSVDAADKDDWTPLHVACYSGHTEITKLLIKHGAKLELATCDGMRPLHIACRYGHTEIVHLLLQNGAITEARPKPGFMAYPLHVAACYGHADVVELLIKFKAQTDVTDYGGWLPLHYACQQGHLNVVELLLSARFTHGRHSHQLHISCHNGHTHFVRSLLQCGLCTHDPQGKTAVCGSCYLSNKMALENLSHHQTYPDKSGSGNITALFLATQNGHYEVVAPLLKAGACTEVRVSEGWTPLLIASFKGHHHIVELLLQFKTDVNDSLDDVLLTALHLACANGHRETMEVLLYHGATADKRDTYGCSPLHRACINGRSNVLPGLLARVKDEYTDEKSAGRLLSFASGNDSVDVICSLREWLPGIFKIAQESPALHEACRYGNVDIVKVFLEHDFPVNTNAQSAGGSQYRGQTPIHIASANGHSAVVEALISRGANVNEKTSNGDTALLLACQENRTDVVRVLLQKGSADTEIKNEHGQTSLHIAARKGFDIIVTLLVAHNADVNAQDPNGETSLIFGRRYTSIVDILLANNADVTVRSADGGTVLHTVCTYGEECTLRSLLTHGINLETKDRNGETALFRACRTKWRRHSMVKLLLDSGANVEASDEEGTTPVQLASRLGDMDLLQELLQHGGKVDSRNKNGETPLHQACKEGHSHLIDVLLQAGAFVDEPDHEGNTPLHKACANLHTDSVRVLLERGANVRVKNKDGSSPMNVHSVNFSDAQISEKEKRHRHEKRAEIMFAFMEFNQRVADKDSHTVTQGTINDKFQETDSANYGDTSLESHLKESADLTASGRMRQIEVESNGMKKGSQIAKPEREASDIFDDATELDDAKDKKTCTLEGSVQILDKGEKVERDNTRVVISMPTQEADTKKLTKDDLKTKTVSSGKEDTLSVHDHVFPDEQDGNSFESLTGSESARQTREAMEQDKDICSFHDELASKEQPVSPEVADSPEVAEIIERDKNPCSFQDEHVSKGQPVTPEHSSPLHRACFQGSTDLVLHHLLISSNVDVVSKAGRTALHYACAAGHHDIAALLLQHGANPSLKDPSGRTCLHEASLHGHVCTVDLLMIQVLDVNLVDKDGRTALHLASSQGHGLVASLLVSHGAKINLTDDLGNTALMLACTGSHSDVCVILLNLGADLEIRNEQGEDVRDVARSRNLFLLEKVIARHSVDKLGWITKKRLCQMGW